MTQRALTAALLALLLTGAAAPALAQTRQTPAVPQAPAVPQVIAPRGPLSEAQRAELERQNAYQTAQDLMRVMRQDPPAVGEVLQRDPSLLDRPDYMAAYPALVEFIQQHPEVPRNAGFYFGSYQYRERTSREDAVEMMQVIMAGIAGGTVILTLVSVFVWLVKTLVDHRRWLRQSRVQVEMHTKLVDRLTNTDDLLSYTQSPAGSRFLESAPFALDAETRASAPIGRIIWSMQAGVVLMFLGIGLRWVQNGAIEEVKQGLWMVSAIAGSVGAGLLVSSVAAYLVSSRLGLLPARRA